MTFRPERLSEDIASKPALLRRLATEVRTGDTWSGVRLPRRMLLVGMGSSYFAADAVAGHLRRHDVLAVAERSSAEHAWPLGPGDLAVAISATGASVETLSAVERFTSSIGTQVVGLTNATESPLSERCALTVDLGAGVEVSGVSALSFVATIVRLLELEVAVAGRPEDLAGAVERAADAVEGLISSAGDWLDAAVDDLAGPHGTWLLAPAERLSSARQGALMLREVPRRPADACETGDWSHVDVYLTKTLDYRAMVFAGSRWDQAAAEWMIQRGSTFWAVGAHIGGATRALRYDGADDEIVALLTEVTVAELIASRLVDKASPIRVGREL